jgi:hypothetical protein
MLIAISTILISFWLLGVLTSHTLGGLIHFIPAVAIIMVLRRLIKGGEESVI